MPKSFKSVPIRTGQTGLRRPEHQPSEDKGSFQSLFKTSCEHPPLERIPDPEERPICLR